MIILGSVEVKGHQYAIVESAEGGYINGIYSKYLLVPMACVDKTIPDDQKVEIVKE